MKKGFLITLLVLLLIGIALIATGLVAAKGDWRGVFSVFAKDEREEKTVIEESTVTSVSLNIGWDDLEILPSEDGLLKIEYADGEKSHYTYTFSDGKAVFCSQKKFLRNMFSFGVQSWKVRVYLPDTVNGEIDIHAGSGAVSCKQALPLSVDSLKVDMGSGRCGIEGITANAFHVESGSGAVELLSVNAGTLSLECASGEVILRDCLAETFSAEAASGSLTAQNCVFTACKAKTASGNINFDELVCDGADIDTASGSVNLKIAADAAEFSVNAETDSGYTRLSGTGLSVESPKSLHWGNGVKLLKIRSASGHINLCFR